MRDDRHIDFQEITLRAQHPWNGRAIRDLDLSRQSFIVVVRRGTRALIPNGDLVLRQGDAVILYTQKHMQDAETVSV